MENNENEDIVVFTPEATPETKVSYEEAVSEQSSPDQSQVNQQQNQLQQAPQAQPEQVEDTYDEDEVVYSPEENIYPPHKIKQIQKTLREGAKGTIEGLGETQDAVTRIGAKTIAKGVSQFNKGLSTVAKGNYSDETAPSGKMPIAEYTNMFGKWLEENAPKGDKFLKDTIDKYLGKSSSSVEDSFTELGERFAKIYTQYPIPGMAPIAFFGALGGQVSKEFGASPEMQQNFEIIGMLGKDVGKKVLDNIRWGSYTLQNFWKGSSWPEKKKIIDMFKRTPSALKELFTKNPSVMGEVTGLKGAELEAFDALGKAEKETNDMLKTQRKTALADVFEAEKTGIIGEKSGEEIGLSESEQPILPKLTEEEKVVEDVLGQVHPKELGNFRDEGKLLDELILNEDTKLYKTVDVLYEKSRSLNGKINIKHPEMTQNLFKEYKKLERIPKRSSVQDQLFSSLENILQKTGKFKKGKLIGFKKINNQVLIDQIQSLRQILDFDFAHGSPTGIFRPSIDEIQQSVFEAALESGDSAAAETLNKAQQTYKKWSRKFNNKYINQHRDISNKGYESLLNKNITDPDHFNVIKDVIGETEEGKNLIGGIQRERTENVLGEYINDPIKVKSRAYRRAKKILESTLSPTQLGSIDAKINKPVSKTLVQRKQKIFDKNLKALDKELTSANKYLDKDSKIVSKLVDDPRNVLELKEDLYKIKTKDNPTKGKELFNNIAKQKVKSIVSGGLAEGQIPTGKEMYNILKKQKNLDLLSAYTSPEEAKAVLEEVSKMANAKFTMENAKKIGLKLSKYKLLSWLLL